MKQYWFVYLVFVFVCMGVGSMGGLVTADALPVWYEQLKKPMFQPPSWVFGPVWTLLYVLMAVAGSRIWLSRHVLVSRAMLFFSLQLTLNFLWSLVFFGLRLPGVACIIICILWGAIFYTHRIFSRIDANAGFLIVPYILWVTFAAVLNISIVLLN